MRQKTTLRVEIFQKFLRIGRRTDFAKVLGSFTKTTRNLNIFESCLRKFREKKALDRNF